MSSDTIILELPPAVAQRFSAALKAQCVCDAARGVPQAEARIKAGKPRKGDVELVLGDGARIIGNTAYNRVGVEVFDALPDDVRDDPYAIEELDAMCGITPFPCDDSGHARNMAVHEIAARVRYRRSLDEASGIVR